MFDTVDNLPPEQRLLVRIDVNAPIEDGVLQDTRRFARHAETIDRLLDDGHAIALLAHQGRPGRDTFVSLESHTAMLEHHMEHDLELEFVDDTHGDAALGAIQDLDSGEVLLLENVRFLDAELADATPEEHAKSEFVQTLAPEFDAFVNDGYSVAHRGHASIVGFPQVMNAYAGPVMAEEYEANTSIRRREFDGPVVLVLGGVKAADLVPAAESLLDRVDHVLVGGVIGELFLRADGYDLGYDVDDADLYDDNWEGYGDRIEALLDDHGDRFHLPVDLARESTAGERVTERVEHISKEQPYYDIGEATIDAYRPVIEDAAAVLVKGGLGVFEDPPFSYGTRGVFRAIANSDCFSVIGGGDTARAIDLYDMNPDDFDHRSVAGGAYLRALTGEDLVGVEALSAAAATNNLAAATASSDVNETATDPDDATVEDRDPVEEHDADTGESETDADAAAHAAGERDADPASSGEVNTEQDTEAEEAVEATASDVDDSDPEA